MCKSIGKALNPHRLCPSSSNGYLVERKSGTAAWMATAEENTLHSPQENETVKELVPISGGNWCKVRWAFGDIWTIEKATFTFTFINTRTKNATIYTKAGVCISSISKAAPSVLWTEEVSSEFVRAWSCLENCVRNTGDLYSTAPPSSDLMN